MSTTTAAAAASSSSSVPISTRQHPPTSPPPSIASPSTTPALAIAHNTSPTPPPPPAPLQPTLPSAETQRHVAQARAAVVATMENMMDSELQWRASTLHSNATALGKQAKDVRRATDGLRKESEKLAREADIATRRIKELGNVQNWAEVLERDFLVLEETVRLANRSGSGSGSCSCSCSECGSVSESGSEDNRDPMDVDDDDDDDDVVGKKLEHDTHGGASKARVDAVEMNIDTIQDSVTGTWSEASRSLTDPESSTGRGAKGSDTASTMS